MPELPEVETIANGLNKRVAGDRIDSVWVGSKPEPLKSTAAEISARAGRRQVERVRRVGKHIVFDLEPGKTAAASQWIVHLGMTGKMLVATPETENAQTHTFGSKTRFRTRIPRFVDSRRFGRLEVRQAGFNGPGAEPLNIGVEEFARLFHASKACGNMRNRHAINRSANTLVVPPMKLRLTMRFAQVISAQGSKNIQM